MEKQKEIAELEVIMKRTEWIRCFLAGLILYGSFSMSSGGTQLFVSEEDEETNAAILASNSSIVLRNC